MDKRSKIMVSSSILGILLGFSLSAFVGGGQSYCEKTESAIIDESNITGAVACFEPGVIDFNSTERVRDNSNLKCVCRKSEIGKPVQIWGIYRASQ